jgi:hypothetical protein
MLLGGAKRRQRTTGQTLAWQVLYRIDRVDLETVAAKHPKNRD